MTRVERLAVDAIGGLIGCVISFVVMLPLAVVLNWALHPACFTGDIVKALAAVWCALVIIGQVEYRK